MSIKYVSDKIKTFYFTGDHELALVEKIEKFITPDNWGENNAMYVSRKIPQNLTITTASVPTTITKNYINMKNKFYAQLVYREILFEAKDLPLYKERYFNLVYARDAMLYNITEKFNNLLQVDLNVNYPTQDIPIDICLTTEIREQISNIKNFSTKTTYLGFLLYETIFL